jgi:hypothetical protein
MAYDLAELRFCGLANTIAIEEFAASFDAEHGINVQKSLYREYLDSGSPSDQREWLRPRIASLFECLDTRPNWIERSHPWPFLNGKPMVFIGQVSVPQKELSERALSPGSEVYLFGSRVAHKEITNGWEIIYQVVTQHRNHS